MARYNPKYRNNYRAYRNRYDYYLYLKLCASREGLKLKDIEKVLNVKEYKGHNICAGITRLTKAELIALANYYKINIKLWSTKSSYVYLMFEDSFSPDEKEEILRQRIWEPSVN